MLFLVLNSVTIDKKDTLLYKKDENITKQVKENISSRNPAGLENTELVIDNLTFKSRTRDHESYTIVASKALKLENETYYINDIIANIGLEDGAVKLSSKSGKFDDERKLLELDDKIIAKYSGYILKTDSLIIDIIKKELLSTSPVLVEEDGVMITADSFRTKEQKIIVFEGNVKTIFNFSN